MSEGGPFVLQDIQHHYDPWDTTNVCFGTIFVNGNTCHNDVYSVFRGITTFDPNKSTLSKQEKEKQHIKHNSKGLRGQQIAHLKRLPPTISRWASESGKWPILSPPTPSVQLQFLYRSSITIMSRSPAFKRSLTCTVPPKQQSSSWLSSPTAKTH